MQQTFFTLDFDDIKGDIKNYIKNNSELLKDYNYEGSAISEIINVLAYVTQYQSFYLNMVANELFMNTAQIKKNVYKLATMMGYVPTRATAPFIEANFQNASVSNITIPRYTKYTMGDASLVSLEDVLVEAGSSATLNLYEGSIIASTFTIPERNSDGLYITTSTASSGPDFTTPLQQYLKFKLADYEFVDNNYLYVFDKQASTEEEWTQINNENPVFGEKYFYLQFLDELQIMFDNGAFFAAPETGEIYCHYLLTSGTLYNNTSGAITFDSATFTGVDSISINVAAGDLLSNGTDPETLEAIKNNAPLWYTANNRAVTKQDYNIVIKKYPSYDALFDIHLWGGQDEYIDGSYKIQGLELDPTTAPYRDLGYVYYSGIKPSTYALDEYDYSYLTDTDKLDIENYLSRFKVMSIFFKPFDPNIIYFKPYVSVSYNTGFADSVAIASAINSHLSASYSGFNKSLNLSNITQYVDNLADVAYSNIYFTTQMKVLNDGPRGVLNTHDIDYKEHKVLRFSDTVSQSSIESYVMVTETLSGTNTIYNDAFIYTSSANTASILDNNSPVNAQYTDSPLYLSVSLYSGSTLTAGATFYIYKSGTTLAELVTVSEIYKFWDAPSLATLGDIMLNSTTIGKINYDIGFATISTTGTTLSSFTSYTFMFDYTDSIHHDYSVETMLSPKLIDLTELS